MYKISAKDVFNQLKKDLIGKDSYRGVTLSYAWLANQFGHFSLGFIPTILLYRFWFHCFKNHNAAQLAALSVSVGWFLFELFNFIGPLLSNRSSKSNLVYIPSKKYVFTPPWKNVAFDTFTDLCYFWLGAFVASIVLKGSWIAVIVILVLCIILIWPSQYWYKTKMYLQEALYPYQIRLSQWQKPIDSSLITKINAFINQISAYHHILIYGGRKNDKTGLAVGICTELSIKGKICSYITANKLYNQFFAQKQINQDTRTGLWNWKTAEYLIIDDINPGTPVKDLMSPKKFLQLVDAYDDAPNQTNRDALIKKNTVWVLGDSSNNKTAIAGWETLLNELGVKKHEILIISLDEL